MSVLRAFCRHFNIILIYFYWLFILVPVVRFHALLSRVFRKPAIWILSQFNKLVATWCGIWVCGIPEQITNSLYHFFFCLLVLYFYIAPSWVFFEDVSSQLCFVLSSLFQVGIYNSVKTNKNHLVYTRSSLDHLIKEHNLN